MTLRLLGWAAAPGLIVALASVVFYGAGKDTHLPCLSLGFLFDSHEGITTLSPGGLFGGEWPLPPEGTALGTAAPRSSTPSTTRQAAGRRRSVVYHCCRSGCQDMLRRTRGSSRCSFLVYALFNLISGQHLRSCAGLLLWRRAARAARTSLLQVLVV